MSVVRSILPLPTRRGGGSSGAVVVGGPPPPLLRLLAVATGRTASVEVSAAAAAPGAVGGGAALPSAFTVRVVAHDRYSNIVSASLLQQQHRGEGQEGGSGAELALVELPWHTYAQHLAAKMQRKRYGT